MEVLSFLNCGAIVDTGKGTSIIGWGKRTWLEKQNNDQISFYFPDFFLLEKQPWFIHESTAEISHKDLLDLLNKQTKISQNSITWKNTAKPIFEKAFENLQLQFHSKKLLKAVPYIFEEAHSEMSEQNILHSLCSLLKNADKYPIFPYGFWGENEGILGATPEILFGISCKTLETVACAGTCPREDADKMQKDSKLCHEHQLVVQGIRESLSRLGNLNQGKMHVQKYSKLCHLITPLHVELTELVTLDEVTQLLHPTPALGAYPRKEGMHWLKEYNKAQSRERFGAPVGFTRYGDSTCYVAIRNIQWKESHLKLGAGCGIVPESCFENEWSEILLKIKSTKDILSL